MDKPEAQERTVNDLVKEYLDFKQTGKNALVESTMYYYTWTWKKYISPSLGKKNISKVTDADINNFFVSLKKRHSLKRDHKHCLCYQ